MTFRSFSRDAAISGGDEMTWLNIPDTAGGGDKHVELVWSSADDISS